MQLVLELLKKIFVALSGIYTKQESDAQLAVKADKAEVEAEAQARQEADAALGVRIDSGDSKLSRAELIEKWRDKTYCELTIAKIDGYNTSRLPRIEANGIWWIDLDDGNGAQMRLDDNVQIEFEWGAQTEKKIVIYGNVVKIYNETADVDGNYRYYNRCLFLVSGIVQTLQRSLVFPNKYGDLSVYLTISSKDFESWVLFGYSTDKYANLSTAQRNGNECKIRYVNQPKLTGSGLISYSNFKSVEVVSDGGCGGIGSGTNGSVFSRFVVSVNVEDTIGIFLGNFYAQKNLTYINTALATTTGTFAGTWNMYGMTDFVGTMPNLSDAPSLFVGAPLNVVSIVGILNKLPTYTDGGQHRIGFTVTGSTTAGIASEATTETFTATDDDGTEYSVENCPRFINDDADSSLRKAYVLAIAKKGWEVII